MKRLQEFIIENVEIIESKSETKSITFNFKDLENAEDTLKSFEEEEYCTIEEESLTVSVTADNCTKLDSVKDKLKKYSDELRHSTKRSSNEQYAQKTLKFEEQVKSLENAIEELSDKDEKEKKDDKKEEE